MPPSAAVTASLRGGGPDMPGAHVAPSNVHACVSKISKPPKSTSTVPGAHAPQPVEASGADERPPSWRDIDDEVVDVDAAVEDRDPTTNSEPPTSWS